VLAANAKLLRFGPQAREAAEARKKDEWSTSHRLDSLTRRLRLETILKTPEMGGGNPDSGIGLCSGPCGWTDPEI